MKDMQLVIFFYKLVEACEKLLFHPIFYIVNSSNFQIGLSICNR